MAIKTNSPVSHAAWLPAGFQKFTRKLYERDFLNKRPCFVVRVDGDNVQVRLVLPGVRPSFTYHGRDKLRLADQTRRASDLIPNCGLLWSSD
jgi:hypothetical protein